MFKKVLIANRGEIALRVVRACQEMGIRSVVVHSTRDRDSAAVRLCDESVQIGPPQPKKSYLNAAAILEAAICTGAEAIHPGYGFLSEDADFAEACEAAEIVFVGPPALTVERLGSKISARALMAKAGLPLLPGSLDVLDVDDALQLAGQIGFPVIVKASAGGGGRGMRVIDGPDGFTEAYRETRSTALMLFGDGRVYLEKYLRAARHVEIQILCDGHGNAIYLGARDCSVQRRHQKLVEESPAPGLSGALLAEMGQAVRRGALSAGYEGAGTFEFLLAPDGAYFFMEVNCRIQVEHPVTEMVTGIDIVQEQLRIAAGEPLRIGQSDVQPRGVAIECRINAEDPGRDFAPTVGTVHEFVPAAGPFVRVDTHVRSGDAIPPDYDSLLAKLIVWAPDREGAIARMRRALNEFRITGDNLSTTREFLLDVIDHPRFRAASHSTSLVEEMLAGIDADVPGGHLT
ncbi:acetyl/propionyl/methylcrotonyl-CoA carboxylase subunit alpha [Actinomadura sp. HBU206391]|uniref:acetyl-CoA carboxylase biotin carboxylase subunit n=1 Tax=Actinomadura sp. HBU206391 TaxID=2731692 RepID=UPI00164FC309|nr:acetyl-CoA carboxylase biotin carboxylase subunit [Actinomadura sp. HBU206391]MBC6456905.1 acetyl-CoA carboxylase biotin carboxylase subunit [Actinomadura sp. HBU206391]